MDEIIGLYIVLPLLSLFTICIILSAYISQKKYLKNKQENKGIKQYKSLKNCLNTNEDTFKCLYNQSKWLSEYSVSRKLSKKTTHKINNKISSNISQMEKISEK